ncbi:MAG: hypothetical protein QM648_02650 [Solirubrobacterales bacterium]
MNNGAGARSAASAPGSDTLLRLGIAAAVAAVAGSFGPWIEVMTFASIDGMNADGAITLAAGVAALLLCGGAMAEWLRGSWVPILTLITGVVCIGCFANSGRSVFSSKQDGLDVFGTRIELLSPGWGLWAVGAAGVVLVCVSAMLIAREAPDHRFELWPPSGSRATSTFVAIGLAVGAFVAVALGVVPEKQLDLQASRLTPKPGNPMQKAEPDPRLNPPGPEDFGGDPLPPSGTVDAKSPDKVVAMGKTLLLPGDWSYRVRVTGAKVVDLVPGNDKWGSLTANGRWVVVAMTVSKGKKDAQASTFEGWEVKLVDSNGKLHDALGGFGRDVETASFSNLVPIYNKDGVKTRGVIVFDVPKDVSIEAVQFKSGSQPTIDEQQSKAPRPKDLYDWYMRSQLDFEGN